MLPKSRLIPLKKEYPLLRKTGRWFDSESLKLLVSPTPPGTSGPRFAFIVSKKVSLKSVERHRVKRKLSSVVEILLPALPQTSQIVVLAKQAALKKTSGELSAELQKLLTSSNEATLS